MLEFKTHESARDGGRCGHARLVERSRAVPSGRRARAAGALNLLGDRVLSGRYWGATEHRAVLHFNLCYYHGIEECIGRNLSRFELGAGGEHKLARGFVPTETRSAHYLRAPVLDAAVRDFTRWERAAIRAAIARWKLGYQGWPRLGRYSR